MIIRNCRVIYYWPTILLDSFWLWITIFLTSFMLSIHHTFQFFPSFFCWSHLCVMGLPETSIPFYCSIFHGLCVSQLSFFCLQSASAEGSLWWLLLSFYLFCFGRWPIAVGAKLPRIYCKSTAMDARSTRASRPSTWSARNPMQILHDRHRQVLHDRHRYHRHSLHQRKAPISVARGPAMRIGAMR